MDKQTKRSINGTIQAGGVSQSGHYEQAADLSLCDFRCSWRGRYGPVSDYDRPVCEENWRIRRGTHSTLRLTARLRARRNFVDQKADGKLQHWYGKC